MRLNKRLSSLIFMIENGDQNNITVLLNINDAVLGDRFTAKNKFEMIDTLEQIAARNNDFIGAMI